MTSDRRFRPASLGQCCAKPKFAYRGMIASRIPTRRMLFFECRAQVEDTMLKKVGK